MKLSGVIWLEEIVEKIERKHHVTQNEVREILRNSLHFRFVEKGHRRGENVYSALRPDKRWPLSDCVLCAQENGSSFTDIGAGHDIRREETI